MLRKQPKWSLWKIDDDSISNLEQSGGIFNLILLSQFPNWSGYGTRNGTAQVQIYISMLNFHKGPSLSLSFSSFLLPQAFFSPRTTVMYVPVIETTFIFIFICVHCSHDNLRAQLTERTARTRPRRQHRSRAAKEPLDCTADHHFNLLWTNGSHWPGQGDPTNGSYVRSGGLIDWAIG